MLAKLSTLNEPVRFPFGSLSLPAEGVVTLALMAGADVRAPFGGVGVGFPVDTLGDVPDTTEVGVNVTDRLRGSGFPLVFGDGGNGFGDLGAKVAVVSI